MKSFSSFKKANALIFPLNIGSIMRMARVITDSEINITLIIIIHIFIMHLGHMYLIF